MVIKMAFHTPCPRRRASRPSVGVARIQIFWIPALAGMTGFANRSLSYVTVVAKMSFYRKRLQVERARGTTIPLRTLVYARRSALQDQPRKADLALAEGQRFVPLGERDYRDVVRTNEEPLPE